MTKENTIKIETKNGIEENLDESDFLLDFATSSAISRINIKFLAVYIPIFWFGGMLSSIYWYSYTAQVNRSGWLITMLFLPFAFLSMLFLFVFGCLFISKLILIFVNLIHRPKEGIFKAEIGDTDFEFWCLRIELKKLVLWMMRNIPLPWIDTLAFRWFGVKMDFSSHLLDAWVDVEFVQLGRKVMIGQGTTIMSSMVVGKYLIIKKVIIDDYVVVGGQAVISPGTIIGKNSMIGAVSTTNYKQFLESGWIYFGIPGIKLKPNKYAEEDRDVIRKIDIDKEEKIEVDFEVNIDEDKKDLV